MLVQCLSPMMIIFRVVTRQAWDRQLVSDIQSQVRFRAGASTTVIEMAMSSRGEENPGTLSVDGTSDSNPWNHSQKSIVKAKI